jgi:hypothetical protein
MHDLAKINLIVGLVALVTGVIFLTVFAFYTSGASRNISLALGTLLGAAMLLWIQLQFELRGSRTSEFISTEFTYDLAKPALRQWQYPVSLSERAGNELSASQHLSATHPEKFTGDQPARDRLVRDMSIFSLVTYIVTKQHDWQTMRRRAKIQDGSIEFFQWTSRPEDCSFISDDTIRHMLQKAENPFADVRWSPDVTWRPTCLPPKTIIRIEPQSLVLKNPFCQITFRLAETTAITSVPPRDAVIELKARGITNITLPDGTARFVTYDAGFDVEVKYSAIRAQHRDQQKYATWAREMIDGARNWFESRPNAGENWIGGLDANAG